MQLAYYQHKLKQGYDMSVKLRPLAPGDLVLRKVVGCLGKIGAQLGRTISHYVGGRNRCILLRRFR